jgi:hypothetical protein
MQSKLAEENLRRGDSALQSEARQRIKTHRAVEYSGHPMSRRRASRGGPSLDREVRKTIRPGSGTKGRRGRRICSMMIGLKSRLDPKQTVSPTREPK